MSTFYPKYDYDPNTTKETVTGEAHVIPDSAPYETYLKHIPRKESPSSITISGSSITWTEVTGTPSTSGQFRVDYGGEQGRIEFYIGDAGKSILVNYNACGTIIWAETYLDGREGINKIQEKIETHTHTTEDLPSASTSAKGIVQLDNTTSSTSTALAATANAVKITYDKANHSHPYAASSHTHTKANITDFPATMPPTAHKDTHAGGSDAITPADIGAETPSGAQAKVENYAVAKAGDTMQGTLAMSGQSITFGNKFRIKYNSSLNTLDIEVI